MSVPEPEKRPKTRRRRRVVLLVLAGIAAVLTVASVLLLWVFWGEIEDRVRDEIERRVSEKIDGELRIGELHVRPFPLSLDLRDVELRIPAEGDPLLRASVAHATAGIPVTAVAGLAGGRIRLSDVRLEEPAFELDQEWVDRRKGRKKKRRVKVDVRVDRLEIVDGVFWYQRREIPLEVLATEIGFQGAWSPYRQSLGGEISFATTVVGGPIGRPWPVSVRAGVRAQETRVDFFDVTARGPGADVLLESAKISWSDRSFFTAGGSLDVDLGTFGEWFREGMPEVAGRLRGDARISQGEGLFQILGEVSGEGVRFGPLVAASARADVAVDRREVHLTRLRANAYGGRIRGEMDVDVSKDRGLRLDLEGEAMDLASLLGLLNLPLPLAGDTEFSLEFTGKVDDRSTWNGEGAGRVTAKPPLEGYLPVGGDATIVLADGRLDVEAPILRAAGAEGSLAIEMDLAAGRGVLQIAGTTPDAEETRSGVVFLMAAVGVDPVEALERPVTGRGNFDARIGLGEPRFLSVDLELRNGSWNHYPFRALDGSLAVVDDRVSVPRFDVTGADWSVRGAVEADLSDQAVSSVEIDAGSFPLGPVLTYLGYDTGLDGRITGDLRLDRTREGLEGSGQVEFRGGTLAGEPVESVSGTVHVERNLLRSDDVLLKAPGGTASGRVLVDLAAPSARLELLESSIRLSDLKMAAGYDLEADCLVGARGALTWSREELTGLLDVTAEDLELWDQKLGSGAGTVRFEPDGMSLDLVSRSGPSWRVNGLLDWDDRLSSHATLDFEAVRFDLPAPESTQPAWVRLSGSLSAAGPLANPVDMAVDGALRDLDLRLGARRLVTEGDAPISYANRRLRVGPARFASRFGGYDATFGYNLQTGRMDGSLRGAADLGLLAILFRDTRAGGRVDLDLEMHGTPSEPSIDGTIALDDGRIRLLGFPQPFEGVELEARFEGDEAQLTRFSAVIGGGEVHGTGGMLFEGFAPGSYRLEAAAANVRIDYPEGFRGVYEGSLLVRGDSEEALLSGEVAMLRGLYSKEFAFLNLLGGATREYSAKRDVSLPVQLYYDLDFRAEENVWVRNELADLEAGFALHVGGKYEKPEVTGRLILLEGGELEFRDVTYRIETGTLDFVDLDRIDPYMSIQARTEVENYEIRLRIEGTSQRFEYELTSNPSLSPQDIIAVLTTGKTLEELHDPVTGTSSARYTGDVAGSYFAGALTAPFERQLEKTLGLSRFSINPLLVGSFGDPTARVTIGKEVIDDVNILYSVDLGNTENQLYQLQWKVSRKLGFNLERATTGSNAGDLLYLTRFWLKKPPASDRPPGRAGLPALPRPLHGATVGSVAVEGVGDDDREDLLRSIPLAEGGTYSRSVLYQGTEAIRRYYVRRGRIGARIDSQASEDATGRVTVIYRVDPGPVYHVELDGARKKDRKKIRKRLGTLWSETMFTEFLLEDSARLVEEYYRGRGHYTVDVTTVEEDGDDPDESRILRFLIDPGPEVEIVEVRLDGNEAVDEDRIRKQILTRRSSVFAKRVLVPEVLDDDVVAVRHLYLDEGFMDVEVSDPGIRLSADGSSASVTIEVAEGPRFTVGEIEVPGDLEFTPGQLRAWSGMKVGEVFSPKVLEKGESSLRAALDARGYPEARVNAWREASDETVRVFFQVVTGRQLRVWDVEISGNHITRDRIVERELLLGPGDLISREKIIRTQHQLYRLGIFRNVRIDYVPAGKEDPSLQTLRVRVEDARPLGASVGAGYDTEAGPRLSVSVSHDNVYGYDRTILLQGRYSGLERRVQLLAREPRLFTRQWPALFSFLWEEEEREGFRLRRRSTAFRVDRAVTERWQTFMRYNFQRVDLFDVDIDDSELIRQKLENLRLGDISYAVIYDSRDDPFMTRRGKFGSLETRLFAPVFVSDASFVKAMFKGGWTVPLGRGHSASTALRIGASEPYSNTPEVPISERFFAGGESTVRGFPLDGLGPKDDRGIPIGGEGLFIFNQEWRYPIWKSFIGVVFYDAGNVWPDASGIDLLDLRHVLGAGFRLEMPIGPIRVEYGRKLDREEGESLGEFFFAIGFVL